MTAYVYGDKVMWRDQLGTPHKCLVVNVIRSGGSVYYALWVPGEGLRPHSVQASALMPGWEGYGS